MPAITVGTSATLSARPLDSSGVSVGGVPLLWTTSNSAVLTVSASHGESVQVTGQSMGSAFITAATPNGYTAQRSIIVHCGGSTSPAAVNLSGDGVSGTIALTTSGCNWSTAIDSSWLSVNPSSGSGSGQVGYTVQPNDTSIERTGTVTFKGSDGFTFAVFTVNQARRHCTGGLSPAVIDVVSAGGSGFVFLTVQGDCPWTVMNDSPSWLSVTRAAGAGSATMGYTVQANSTTVQRTGTVTIKGPDGSAFAVLTVTQHAFEQCAGGTFPSGYPDFPDEGGTSSLDLTITGPCHWVAATDSAWLHVNPPDNHGSTSQAVGYTVDPNPTGSLRISRITFSGAEDGLPFAVFLVAQYGGINHAPRLDRNGYRFTVNGEEKYLIFVSYFDALRRAVGPGGLNDDFAFLAANVDGIRIFPNWLRYNCLPNDNQVDDALFDATGEIQDVKNPNWRNNHPPELLSPWDRLLVVLNTASANSLIVDVSFAGEIPPTVAFEKYRSSLQEVAKRLRGQYPNVFFDLQNEFNGKLTETQARGLVEYAKCDGSQSCQDPGSTGGGDPNRIVFASESAESPQSVGRTAKNLGFEVVGYHDRRDSEWPTTQSKAQTVVQGIVDSANGLQGAMKPIYLQEPMPWTSLCGKESDDVEGHFTDAVKWYKAAGAAAWTFHTRDSFVLGAQKLTEKMSDAEKITITRLRASADSVAWGVLDPTEVVFYSDVNFNGANFLAGVTEIADLAGRNWSQRISSIHIPPGKTVILYDSAISAGPL